MPCRRLAAHSPAPRSTRSRSRRASTSVPYTCTASPAPPPPRSVIIAVMRPPVPLAQQATQRQYMERLAPRRLGQPCVPLAQQATQRTAAHSQRVTLVNHRLHGHLHNSFYTSTYTTLPAAAAHAQPCSCGLRFLDPPPLSESIDPLLTGLGSAQPLSDSFCPSPGGPPPYSSLPPPPPSQHKSVTSQLVTCPTLPPILRPWSLRRPSCPSPP